MAKFGQSAGRNRTPAGRRAGGRRRLACEVTWAAAAAGGEAALAALLQALDAAVEEWEDDQEDRKAFFEAFIQEIWARPIDVIMGKIGSDDDEADAK